MPVCVLTYNQLQGSFQLSLPLLSPDPHLALIDTIPSSLRSTRRPRLRPVASSGPFLIFNSITGRFVSSTRSETSDTRLLKISIMASYRPATVTLCLVLATILGAASHAQGQNLFSKLPNALTVTATLLNGTAITEITVAQDTIVVSWKANATSVRVPITATRVQTTLCFAKVSQVQRAWRATKDDLSKDKTCQHDISLTVYTPAGASTNYVLHRNIPGATFFVRAYALDANGVPVAYGQSSVDGASNTFSVIPISGRNESLNVAVAVCSILSVTLLFTFLVFESLYLKRKKSV